MTFQLEASPLIWGLFWKGWLLVQKVVHVICSKDRVWLNSVLFVLARNRFMVQRVGDTIFVSKRGLWLKRFSRNEPFSINVPQGINQGDFRVSRFWGLYFWSLKGFGQVWSYSKSWRIPNYQISKPYKNLSFFIVWFLKNLRKRVSKSGVLRPIA